MKTRRFIQCDVFSPEPLKGNGLAVVVDADGIDEAKLQELPRGPTWRSPLSCSLRPILSPTTGSASSPRHGRCRSRGHPTLGSCAAWLHCGGSPKNSGLVRAGVRRRDRGHRHQRQGVRLCVAAYLSRTTPRRRAEVLTALDIAEDNVRAPRASTTGRYGKRCIWPVTEAQGTRINRSGRVFIRPTGEVFIGGATHIVVDGTVTL